MIAIFCEENNEEDPSLNCLLTKMHFLVWKQFQPIPPQNQFLSLPSIDVGDPEQGVDDRVTSGLNREVVKFEPWSRPHNLAIQENKGTQEIQDNF